MSRNNNTGKLYKITCSTDAYHARRNARFDDNETSYVVDAGLTLQEAYTKLLDMFSEAAGRQVRNWGQAVNIHYADGLDAHATYNDGTRSYSYDVYIYSIEEYSPVARIQTSEQLADYINDYMDSHDNDWPNDIHEIIEANGWEDMSDNNHWEVCRCGHERVVLNDEGRADVWAD